MKKIVNGTVVNIDNIELFELAEEGLALQNTAISNTSDGIDSNIKLPFMKKYIKQYDILYKAMPYPLYAIEHNIKYATLGNFIKVISKEKLKMWVNNGLYIKLDETSGMTLKMINNTWSIVYVKEDIEDNTSMDLFVDSIGYKEYIWLLNKIINKDTTANFYIQFMPDFVKACNSEPIILKRELENMLTFGTIPNKIELKHDKIINIDTNEEYTIDIYSNGIKKSYDEKSLTWSLYSGISSRENYRKINTYGFNVYKKSSNNAKLEICNLNGINSLFMELCGIKNAKNMTSFPYYTGVISNNNFIFVIDKRIFLAKSNRAVEPKDIAHGVELYAVHKNKIYFVKSKRIHDKISKETLYSYDIKDGTVKLCKILFRY